MTARGAEAHKARKNFAYCTVVRDIARVNRHFRVLALSATPGSQITFIKEVVQNLLISHLETRSEDDPEVAPLDCSRAERCI
jgi:Fanconi anemia group M protein